MFDKLIDILLEFISFFKFWRVIPINKMGVKIRLGKNPKELKPGLHFIFPFEIDNVKTCIVKTEWLSTHAIHITTKDFKTITVAPVLAYRIIDPIKWLYEANNAADNLHDITRLYTSDILTGCDWVDCVRRPVWTIIKNKIKDNTSTLGVIIEDYGLIDLTLSRVIITSV